MIKLDILDYCHTCPEFEPEKTEVYFDGDVLHLIMCSHKDKCNNIKKHLLNSTLVDSSEQNGGVKS